MSDLIFDIKEFGLHDGNGMRTTVFFKGCPLTCMWCHNPEGQSFEREIIRNLNKCRHCGLCKRECTHEECRGFGTCTKICPEDNVRIAGKEYTPQELAEKLLKNEVFLKSGGVTFSGGEPLCHGQFIIETVGLLNGMNTAVETCGYVETSSFMRTLEYVDDIFMDIKLMNENAHRKYTGVSNTLILNNARRLMAEKRFVTFRIPLIPSVTDTDENLSAIAGFLKPARENIKVELIPYNRMTGAKYASVGRVYAPDFDEPASLNKNVDVFLRCGIDAVAY